MLILTRKTNESIRIEDDIEIVLLSVENGRARIGINAPAAVPVHREEIYNRLKAQAEDTGVDTSHINNKVN